MTLHPAPTLATILAALVPVPTIAATVPVASVSTPEPGVAVGPTSVYLLVYLLFKKTVQFRLYHMHRAREPEICFECRPDFGCELLLN